MNFDRFNLASYFQGEHKDREGRDREDRTREIDRLEDHGISDWGIEETASTPSTNYPPTYQSHPPTYRSYSITNPKHGKNDLVSGYDDSIPSLPATTENFRKYIKKYLSLNLNGAFYDKLKYDLIVSNLLDNSMILSRNEASLNGIMASVRHSEHQSVFVKGLSSDGTKLIVTKNYQLKFPKSYTSNPYNTLILINVVIYLLKRLKYGAMNAVNFKLFKVLLIISTKLMKFQRIYKMILFNTTLNLVQEFLVQNLRANKKIILSLISLKNAKLFNITRDYNSRYTHLNGALDFLIFNIIYTLSTLLPITNGPNLEKYFNINHIQLGEEQESNSSEFSLETLVSKINRFNNLRKMLMCILLTVEDANETNFFLMNLIDRFKSHATNSYTNTFSKLKGIGETINNHSKTVGTFTELLDKFDSLNKSNDSPEENEDILKIKPTEHNSSSNLTHLVDKVSNLSTNLKYFDKYNQSTFDNKGEITEKYDIFKQFKEDLRSINELYKLNLQDLNVQVEDDELMSNSSCSNSNRNSTNSEFNLKSFHTKYKRRSQSQGQSQSMHLSQGNTPVLQQHAGFDSHTPTLKSPTEDYKRTSGPGLKLSLLTVMEDGEQKLKFKKKPEEFNQFTLDQLSKRKASRFSVNSLNSNISGLSDIVTSQTTLDDEDTNCMSKDELKSKLEESLSRLYNLENHLDNESLQGSTLTNTSADLTNTSTDLAGPKQLEDYQPKPVDKSFLENLENSLDKIVS